jgi:hypothetical protein
MNTELPLSDVALAVLINDIDDPTDALLDGHIVRLQIGTFVLLLYANACSISRQIKKAFPNIFSSGWLLYWVL